MIITDVNNSCTDHVNNNNNKNDDDDDGRYIVSCRTLHVGSIPNSCPQSLVLEYSRCNATTGGSNSKISEMDDINYSVEMTLRDFQQFLEEGQSWYSHSPSGNTRQSHLTQLPRSRNWSRNTMMFDPCNALGAEVSLGDFLMHNHNNIDIKVHDAIHSEEIQISDNRRSAVMVIMERQQQGHPLFDDEFNSSLEVQPIHTFDDLMPPNLMNASFDLHNDGDGDDAATVDMNESYSEEPFDDDSNSINHHELGGWLNCDEDENDPTMMFAPPISMLDNSFIRCSNVSVIEPINTNSYDTTINQTDWSHHIENNGTNIDCHPTCTTNSKASDDREEFCEDDSKAMLHVNDQSLICENWISSSDHSTDEKALARNRSTHVGDLLEDIVTDEDCNNDTIGICKPKSIVWFQNFASLLAFQILLLAVSHYVRYLLEFDSPSST